jgi:hypothetical protein
MPIKRWLSRFPDLRVAVLTSFGASVLFLVVVFCIIWFSEIPSVGFHFSTIAFAFTVSLVYALIGTVLMSIPLFVFGFLAGVVVLFMEEKGLPKGLRIGLIALVGAVCGGLLCAIAYGMLGEAMEIITIQPIAMVVLSVVFGSLVGVLLGWHRNPPGFRL